MPDRPNPVTGDFPGPGDPITKPTTPGQAGKGPKIQGDPGSPCLISYPSTSLPVVGTVGGGCIISKTNVRAWVGGLMIGLGGITALIGVGVLAAAGFKKSGAADKIAGVVSQVPGGAVYSSALRGSGSGVTRAVAQRRQAGAMEERRQMRQLGEPRENKGLRTGRGAVRETSAGTRERGRAASREEAGF
jgi:hypothetical protein